MLEPLREAVAAACRRLAVDRLVIGTAGNLSARSGDHVVITPTGLTLAAAAPEDLTVIDLEGRVVEGRYAPTSEVQLHLAIYTAHAAGAVAHAHPLDSTAVACTVAELPAWHYTTAALGGPVRVAPYATFGSRELADGVLTALEGRTAALMAHHGSVAYGDTVDQACDRIEHVEWLAGLHTRITQLGGGRPLSPSELEDVVTAAIQRSYGAPRALAED
ncbi:MAG: L-fuculose-phosphate aldolase [Frankiales bacterium]|nr:L-fuculose-phosphate aldolase [Frankiales bacterium]